MANATTNANLSTQHEVLAALGSGQINAEQATKLLNAINAARGQKSLSCKVSDKGGLSVYGLGRFPVTLYVEQWERLLSFADTIRNFIEANRGSLKRKGE